MSLLEVALHRSVHVVGGPYSGKTTELIKLAHQLYNRSKRIVVFNLNSNDINPNIQCCNINNYINNRELDYILIDDFQNLPIEDIRLMVNKINTKYIVIMDDPRQSLGNPMVLYNDCTLNNNYVSGKNIVSFLNAYSKRVFIKNHVQQYCKTNFDGLVEVYIVNNVVNQKELIDAKTTNDSFEYYPDKSIVLQQYDRVIIRDITDFTDPKIFSIISRAVKSIIFIFIESIPNLIKDIVEDKDENVKLFIEQKLINVDPNVQHVLNALLYISKYITFVDEQYVFMGKHNDTYAVIVINNGLLIDMYIGDNPYPYAESYGKWYHSGERIKYLMNSIYCDYDLKFETALDYAIAELIVFMIVNFLYIFTKCTLLTLFQKV